MTNWLALPLVLIAAISPTLTLLKLWQVKEWRWDRLREHMSREGWWKQLFGTMRPIILSAWLLESAALLAIRGPSQMLSLQLSILLLVILATLGCIQLGRKRQPKPVWTGKTLLLFFVSLAILMMTAAVIASVESFTVIPMILAILPFGCPLTVLGAWLALKPIDAHLKGRIIRHATALRLAHPKLTVIGVTGSVGKTTTKELLAHILKPLGAIATPAHLNAEIGVARWMISHLEKLSPNEHRILIVEMGAYRRGEVALLAEITRPQIGIVTYIGSQHLSLFGSKEAIMQTKGELLRALPKNGHAFLNKDNDAFEDLRKMCPCPVTSVGTDLHADITALDIEEADAGIRFRCAETLFTIPVQGTHLVTSMLLGIAVAKYLGISVKDIAGMTKDFHPLKHTFELKSMRGISVLDDTYNASPTSFRSAIEWARDQKSKRKILLADGIIELGKEEATIHRFLATLAKDVFEMVYIINPHFLPYFKEVLGDRVTLASLATPASEGDLLVCVGRMPKSLIERLLPPEM